MGLFSRARNFNWPDAAEITVTAELEDQLSDPGDLLLSVYDGLGEETVRTVRGELDRVRFPQGGYDLRDVHDEKDGPLHILKWITTGDWIALQVWAANDLGRSEKREMESQVATIKTERGLPTAVAWAVAAWSSVGERAPSLSALRSMLDNGYDEWYGKLTNGMVIDSFRKWRR